MKYTETRYGIQYKNGTWYSGFYTQSQDLPKLYSWGGLRMASKRALCNADKIVEFSVKPVKEMTMKEFREATNQ